MDLVAQTRGVEVQGHTQTLSELKSNLGGVYQYPPEK